MIQAVVQLPASQYVEKCCVIFEFTANDAPNYFGFRIILREFRDQNVKAVIDSATFVMHDVIFAAYSCPNEALARERRIRDNISRVPLLAWLRELAVPAAVTKG